MDDLYFYDFEFKLLHIMSKSKSVNYSLYYNKTGTAEVHTNVSAKLIKILENQTFVVQGDVQWIVTGFKVTRTELIIFGRTLNFLLTRRVVIPFATVKTDAQSLVRKLVTEAYMTDRTQFELKDGRVINIADSSGVQYILKKQDNFELAPPLGETFAESEYRRDVGNTLSECVIDYLNYIKCGHNIEADIKNKKWIFRIFKGTYRNLILSEQNKNCTDTEYTVERQEYFNCGFFEKSDMENEESSTERASDWIFVPGDSTDIPLLRFETVLSGSNNSDAEKQLVTKKVKKAVTASLVRMKYGSDYGLGDSFKINYIFDGSAHTVTVYISGVNISYEKDTYSAVPELEVCDD